MYPSITRAQFVAAVEAGILSARPDISALYVRRLRKLAKTADAVMVGTFEGESCGCPLYQADVPGCGPDELEDTPPGAIPDWGWRFITTFDRAASNFVGPTFISGRVGVLA